MGLTPDRYKLTYTHNEDDITFYGSFKAKTPPLQGGEDVNLVAREVQATGGRTECLSPGMNAAETNPSSMLGRTRLSRQVPAARLSARSQTMGRFGKIIPLQNNTHGSRISVRRGG